MSLSAFSQTKYGCLTGGLHCCRVACTLPVKQLMWNGILLFPQRELTQFFDFELRFLLKMGL